MANGGTRARGQAWSSHDGGVTPQKDRLSGLVHGAGPGRASSDLQRAATRHIQNPAAQGPGLSARMPGEVRSGRASKGNVYAQSRRPVTLQGPYTRPLYHERVSSRAGEKMKLAVLIVLCVTLSLVVVRPFRRAGHNIAEQYNVGPVPVQETTEPDVRIDWSVPEVYPGNLRDLMQANAEQPKELELETDTLKPVVRGIVHSEDQQYAVIGGRIVREGDEVLGATVLAIHPDSVEFEMKGEKWMEKVQSKEK